MELDLPDVEQAPGVAPTWAPEMASVPPLCVFPDDGIERCVAEAMHAGHRSRYPHTGPWVGSAVCTSIHGSSEVGVIRMG
jgi:hypothetical protein